MSRDASKRLREVRLPILVMDEGYTVVPRTPLTVLRTSPFQTPTCTECATPTTPATGRSAFASSTTDALQPSTPISSPPSARAREASSSSAKSNANGHQQDSQSASPDQPSLINAKIDDAVVAAVPTVITAPSCRLGDLWADSHVVICIFRRFGCPICRLGAATISALKPLFDANNVRLVGIGLDRVGIEGFRPYFAGELILEDPERAVYNALSLQKNSWRNLWGLMSGEVHRLIKEVKKRNIDGDMTSGSATRLGGTIVLERSSGRELYLHRQTNDSFEPDLTALTAALSIRLPEFFDAYGYAATIASRLEAQQYRQAR